MISSTNAAGILIPYVRALAAHVLDHSPGIPGMNLNAVCDAFHALQSSLDESKMQELRAYWMLKQ